MADPARLLLEGRWRAGKHLQPIPALLLLLVLLLLFLIYGLSYMPGALEMQCSVWYVFDASEQ
jgi:hypothetical protein